MEDRTSKYWPKTAPLTDHTILAETVAETFPDQTSADFDSLQTPLRRLPMKMFYPKVQTLESIEKVPCCPICRKKFITQALLLDHILTHTGEKPYGCEVCGSAFVQQADLDLHVKTHLVPVTYSCAYCGKHFDIKEESTAHIMKCKSREVMCDVCGCILPHMPGLKKHMKTHEQEGVKKNVTENCGLESLEESSLMLNGADLSNFSDPSKITDDSFLHGAGSKPRDRSQLGEKSKVCELCGKTFTRAYHLKRHLQIHTGEKNYVCETCGKQFTQDAGLKMHLIVHTGEKNHKCAICGKSFTRAWHLKRHYDTHERNVEKYKRKKKNLNNTNKNPQTNTDPSSTTMLLHAVQDNCD